MNSPKPANQIRESSIVKENLEKNVSSDHLDSMGSEKRGVLENRRDENIHPVAVW